MSCSTTVSPFPSTKLTDCREAAIRMYLQLLLSRKGPSKMSSESLGAETPFRHRRSGYGWDIHLLNPTWWWTNSRGTILRRRR